MKFIALQQQEIEANWPTCREILKDSFRQKLHIHAVDDYLPLLLTSECQLWVASDDNEIVGAVVTSIDEGSNARVCNILSLAGKDLDSWLQLLDETLTAFAKVNDCAALEYVGRSGFSKLLPSYVEDGRVFIKLIGEKNG
jgi:hypothetical protein